jgi:hypothetical protein
VGPTLVPERQGGVWCESERCLCSRLHYKNNLLDPCSPQPELVEEIALPKGCELGRKADIVTRLLKKCYVDVELPLSSMFVM